MSRCNLQTTQSLTKRQTVTLVPLNVTKIIFVTEEGFFPTLGVKDDLQSTYTDKLFYVHTPSSFVCVNLEVITRTSLLNQ